MSGSCMVAWRVDMKENSSVLQRVGKMAAAMDALKGALLADRMEMKKVALRVSLMGVRPADW